MQCCLSLFHLYLFLQFEILILVRYTVIKKNKHSKIRNLLFGGCSMSVGLLSNKYHTVQKPVYFPLKWCYICKENTFVWWAVELSMWDVPIKKNLPIASWFFTNKHAKCINKTHYFHFSIHYLHCHSPKCFAIWIKGQISSTTKKGAQLLFPP